MSASSGEVGLNWLCDCSTESTETKKVFVLSQRVKYGKNYTWMKRNSSEYWHGCGEASHPIDVDRIYLHAMKL